MYTLNYNLLPTELTKHIVSLDVLCDKGTVVSEINTEDDCERPP